MTKPYNYNNTNNNERILQLVLLLYLRLFPIKPYPPKYLHTSNQMFLLPPATHTPLCCWTGLSAVRLMRDVIVCLDNKSTTGSSMHTHIHTMYLQLCLVVWWPHQPFARRLTGWLFVWSLQVARFGEMDYSSLDCYLFVSQFGMWLLKLV